MPIATSIGTASTASGTATVTLALGTVPAGCLLIAVVNEAAGNGTSFGTLSDANNGAWTRITGGHSAGATNGSFSMWSFTNSVAAPGTLTFTKFNSASAAAMSVLYVVGAPTSSPIDTAVTTVGESTTANPPVLSITSGTPAVAGELFIAGCGSATSVTAMTQDTTHGWGAPPTQQTTNGFVSGGNTFNGGTGTITFSPTFTATGSTSVGAAIIGIKPDTTSVSYGGNVANATGTTLTLTITNGVPAGSTIVVSCAEQTTTGTLTSGLMADSGGNSYTLAGQTLYGNANSKLGIWYSQNVNALAAGGTITFTRLTSAQNSNLSAGFITGNIGLYDSAAFGSQHNTVTATSATCTSGTPSVSGEYMFFAGANSGGGGWTHDTNWFTPPFPLGTLGGINTDGGWQINAGAAAVTYAMAWGVFAYAGGIIVGFQPGVAPAAGGSNLPMMGVG